MNSAAVLINLVLLFFLFRGSLAAWILSLLGNVVALGRPACCPPSMPP